MTDNEKILADLLDEVILKPHAAADSEWAKRAIKALEEVSKEKEIPW